MISYLNRTTRIALISTAIFSLISLNGCTQQSAKTGGSAKAPPGWTLQFSDDFERAENENNWKALNGNWAIKDGWLTCSGWTEKEIICNKKFPGAHRLEFDARTDENPCDLSGIICTGDYGYINGYLFGFGSEYNTYSQLLAQARQVKRSSAIITAGKTHHQIIQRKDNTLTHIVDGETIMTYEHDRPLKGKSHQKIGFYIYATGQIDNIKVYTKSEE